MQKIRAKYHNLILRIFDTRSSFQENFSFGKRIFQFCMKGFLLSILILVGLTILDYVARSAVTYMDTFPNASILCMLSEKVRAINNRVGIKNIDYLADVVSISAGVLGVLLGLFYTAFLSIITTKYSNTNSTISLRILEQKTLNRYFVLLATLTSLSLLFQFLLALGYNPTFISASIFCVLNVIALTSFIRYGKFSLIFFDTSFLVNDLMFENNTIIRKIIKHKRNIGELNKGRAFLARLYNNIDTAHLIIKETKNPQISNTSLDSISDALLNFAIYFNSIKHTIPSSQGWHLQTQKFKNWEDARETDFSLLKSAGVGLIPDTVESYNRIERKILEAQFDLFRHYINGSDQVHVLLEQNKFLQVNSIQCDFETFVFFFDNLRLLITEKIDSAKKDDLQFRLQLISLYSGLSISYLVGLNHNLKLFNVTVIKKLANAVRHKDNTDKIMQFPYFIRRWMDDYQVKLHNEEYLSGKTITPAFFVEHEIAFKIQNELQEQWKKIITYFAKNLNAMSQSLRDKKFNIETLHLNMECIELSKKIDYFLDTSSGLISNLNNLNFQKHDAKFEFKSLDNLHKKNSELREELYSNIWEVGLSSYFLNKTDLPDIYGSFYHLVLDDILEKMLSKDPDAHIISKYLPKYFTACLLYLESLRSKYKDSENIEFFMSKLYPLIVDLFEVSAIAILTGKWSSKHAITDSVEDFWNNYHKTANDESHFWKWIIAVHDYFKQPLFGLSTPSYIKEHARKRKLEMFLIESNVVRKEQVKHGIMRSYIEEYVSDVADPFVQAIARSMHVDSLSFINLDEVFVEYFLRTRIALKELNIKQTRYGEQLERVMGA